MEERMGALSVTGNPKYREAFEPMIGNIRFAKMNDFGKCVKPGRRTRPARFCLETVQGEGGIYPATEEFMKKSQGALRGKGYSADSR